MRGRLFNFASAVSLLLCILALLSWRASYHALLDINWYGGKTSWNLDISRGQIGIERVEWAGPVYSDRLGWTAQTLRASSLVDAPAVQGYAGQVHFRVAGFAAISSHFRVVTHAFKLVWPCWFMVLLTAVLPTRWIGRRHKRTPECSCSGCGYNLTGNTSGVCPECGTAASRKAYI